jgi:hypothetical protein
MARMFRKIAFSAAVLSASGFGASAQTAMTRANLINDINTYITTNGIGAITGAILNRRLANMSASMITQLDVTNPFSYPPTIPLTGIMYANGSSAVSSLVVGAGLTTAVVAGNTNLMLAPPTTVNLGGVKSSTPSTSVMSGIDTTGAPQFYVVGAGLAINNVPTTPSSVFSCALMPALTGAVTSSLGSCNTSLAGLGVGVQAALGQTATGSGGFALSTSPIISGLTTTGTLGVNGMIAMPSSTSGYSPTPNYATQGIANTQILGVLGSVSTPTPNTSALVVLQKNSNLNTAGIDPTTYTSCRKTTTGSNVSCTAGFFEGVDTAGGTTTFVEGLRTHGLVYGGTLGSSYGAILSGQSASPATTTSYIIGAEGEVLNNLSGDGNAPVFSSFNRDKFKASFVASCNGTYKCDVGFVTNPYNHVAARTGFLVGAGSVDDTGFAIGAGASMATGIDLTQGTYSSAPISIPNNAPLRIMNAAASSRLNTMFADTSNRLVLGTDEASIILATPVNAPALPTSAGSGGIYVCVDTSGNFYKKSSCP